MGEHNAFLLSLNVRDVLNQFSKTHQLEEFFPPVLPSIYSIQKKVFYKIQGFRRLKLSNSCELRILHVGNHKTHISSQRKTFHNLTFTLMSIETEKRASVK